LFTNSYKFYLYAYLYSLFINLKIYVFDIDWVILQKIGLGYVCCGEISFDAVELGNVNFG